MTDEVRLRRAAPDYAKAPPFAPAWLEVHRRAHGGHDYPCYGPQGCTCGQSQIQP